MTHLRLLPPVSSEAELLAALADASIWPRALDAIAERHALPRAPISRASRGSFAVFFYGEELVMKLVPDRFRPQYEAERAMLPHAFGRLSVPTPRLVAEGELDGWGYLVMTKLDGQRLGDVWGAASRDQQVHVARQIGELMASVHALPTKGLDALSIDWPRFVAEQRASAAARHAKTGGDAAWVSEIPAYLDRSIDALSCRSTTPMTADITDDHVLVSERDGRLTVSGFFDFGDALIGDREYDFVSPATFIVRGIAPLMAALLDGYGLGPEARTPELRRRFMTYELLHRFGELRRDVGRLEARGPLASLDAIERAMWPF